MRLITCNNPLAPGRVDESFAHEAEAASRLGIPSSLVSYEAMVGDGDAEKALRRVEPVGQPDIGIYRGWMLRPERYARLYASLAQRGIHLINDSAAYMYCHHLPEWYIALEGHTPRSVWMHTGSDVHMDAVMRLLEPFGATPVILKDFVTSRKHEWAEACYIPSASDRAAVERVVRRFLELQGEDLNEGLVFREFVELEPLGTHPKSGMPLAREFRLFYLDGDLLASSQYWDDGGDDPTGLPTELFTQIARRVRSRFFTMDVARRRDGEWTVIELGDGQVAGLPARMDVNAFYRNLLERPPRMK